MCIVKIEKPKPGATELPVIIDGEEMVLLPTFGAARAITQQFGGVHAAIERVLRADIEAVAEIVAFGLGYYLPTKKPPKDLLERIWRTGMGDDSGGVSQYCLIFLHMIMSGGKMPEEDAEAVPEAAAAPGQEAGKTAPDPQ
jgi:hypothetical protein